MMHGSKKRRKRFSWLKIYWPILYLHQNIFSELTIERFKFLICLFEPVIRTLTVYKCPPHYNAVERGNRISKHVGPVGMSPVIILWTGLTFRICLDKKA